MCHLCHRYRYPRFYFVAIWKNKANFSRIAYCVLRIARMKLKKQSQCQNRQDNVNPIFTSTYGGFIDFKRFFRAKNKANLSFCVQSSEFSVPVLSFLWKQESRFANDLGFRIKCGMTNLRALLKGFIWKNKANFEGSKWM